MENRYAVIRLDDEGRYGDFAWKFKEIFAKQIETMLIPSIEKAASSIVYNLLGKVSEEEYSEDFSKILSIACKEAFQDRSCVYSDEHMTKMVNSIESMRITINNLSQRASSIFHSMDKIQFTGSAHDIKALTDFIQAVWMAGNDK